jgi:hypothetical protein
MRVVERGGGKISEMRLDAKLKYMSTIKIFSLS